MPWGNQTVGPGPVMACNTFVQNSILIIEEKAKTSLKTLGGSERSNPFFQSTKVVEIDVK